MNHYVIKIEPKGSEPTIWEGEAICFMDACIKARRTVTPTLGDNQTLTSIRTFADTTRLTAELPLTVMSG